MFNQKKDLEGVHLEGSDESVYEDDGREELLKNDAINPEEEGFMQGYDREETVVCGFCKTPLVNPEEAVEKILNNKIFRFCSEDCVREFEEDM